MPLVGRRGELGQFVAVSADPDFRMRLGRYEERAGFPTLANFIPDLVILPAHDPTAAQRCLRAGGAMAFDPAPHIADRKTLDAYIDPVRPERYLVDTSKLPRSAG
jgi:hypothetical protein